MKLYILCLKIAMSTYQENNVNPELVNEKMTINSFLRESYNQAKTFIKDEFDKTSHFMNRMALPVNNFLKDLSQIETELIEENNKSSMQYMMLDGQMIPIEQVLSRQMEENY